MNIYRWYSYVVPYSTPIPAALGVADHTFQEFGGSMNPFMAYSSGFFALVGMEVLGGLCSFEAVKTSHEKKWGWFGVYLLGIIAYIIIGLQILWPGVAAYFVVLGIIGNLAASQYFLRRDIHTEKEEDREYESDKREDKILLEKEKTKQLRAQARIAKSMPETLNASNLEQIVAPVRSLEQARADAKAGLEQANAARIRTRNEKLQRLTELLDSDPAMTTKRLAEELGVSPNTVRNYRKTLEVIE